MGLIQMAANRNEVTDTKASPINISIYYCQFHRHENVEANKGSSYAPNQQKAASKPSLHRYYWMTTV